MNSIKLVHVLAMSIWVGMLFVLQILNFKPIDGLQGILKKIYRRFDHLAMLIVLISGFYLLYIKGIDLKSGWFHMKMTGALGLVFVDLWTGRAIRRGKPSSKLLFVVFFLSLILIFTAIYVVKARAVLASA